MKIVNIKNVTGQRRGAPLFTGDITWQSPVVEKEGSDLSIDYVNFPKGVRNKFHKHSNDQVLIVVSGKGFVASRKKKYPLGKGDIVWTNAGEEHCHGAASGSKFTHISVTRAGTKLTQIEE